MSLPVVSLLDFFDRSGPVIFILFVVAIIMITLLVERLIFFISDLKNLSNDRVLEVKECPSDNKWIRNKIKLKNISILNSESSRNLLMIQGLIALCPLLGLLGTVTRMIEVFDIMAITGTGNAKAIGSGIASATLPTMTGLFISIVGLFLLTSIKSDIEKATLEVKHTIETI